MAPPKNDTSGSQKITSFFSRFIIPRERRPDPNSIGDEIIVAPSDAAARRISQQSARSQTSSQSNSNATKKRNIDEDVPCPTASLSSSASDTGSIPKRGRGRPSKSASPSPSRHNSTNGETAALTQSPLRANVNPMNRAADVTPTKDSPYRERGRPSSHVQNSQTFSPKAPTPSPLTDRTRSAPSPFILRAPEFQTTTTTIPTKACSSFSASIGPSVASANSLRSSTSSRRIVKDGLKAVANSDSDMTDDSSGEELADPSSFFTKKRKISPEPVKEAVAPKKARISYSARQSKTFDTLLKSPPKKVYKHSLASLAREGQRIKEEQAKIANMQQAVEESKKREEEAARQEALGLHDETDHSALLEWASDDEDGERRLKALQRVEALHATEHYHFFLDDEPLFEDSAFPVDVLPNEPWAKLYTTDRSREHACTSGLAAELAVYFPLPMAITNWMAQQLLHERDEALCEAYAAILQASGAHDESFSGTIASLSSMYKTRSLFENNWKDHVQRGLPAGLRYMLQVVHLRAPADDNLNPDAPPVKTIGAFLDFAMMNLDDLVEKDIVLSLTLTDCIERLLDSLPETSFTKLVSGVMEMLDDSEKDLSLQFRCRLVAALPSRTARSWHLRRQLALDIFLTSKHDRIDAASPDWDWLKTMCNFFQSEEFDFTESTDYELLMALIEASDIAVSAGFTSYNELHLSQDAIEKRTNSVYTKPPPLSQAAKNHNRQIDAIVSELEYIKSRIQHESTSLCRQEVKAAVERVTARLETSVRTRPKPKRSVFGHEPKQARFAKNMLNMEPTVAGADETEGTEDPPTPSMINDLPSRPGIDDVESSPVEDGDERLLTPAPGEVPTLAELDDEVAVDEDASSSDEFHTAYDISQPRDQQIVDARFTVSGGHQR